MKRHRAARSIDGEALSERLTSTRNRLTTTPCKSHGASTTYCCASTVDPVAVDCWCSRTRCQRHRIAGTGRHVNRADVVGSVDGRRCS